MGSIHIIGALETIWHISIRNHACEKPTQGETGMQPIKLDITLRVAVVALAICTLVRAFFEIFLLGWAFYPLDKLYDWMVKPAKMRSAPEPFVPPNASATRLSHPASA